MTDSGSDSPRDESDRLDSSPDSGSTAPEPDAHGPATQRRGPAHSVDNSVSIEDDGVLRWFIRTDETAVVYTRDLVSSVGLVVLIALVLFAVSGVWPPLVAVESGSMEPNMERGDMIFVVADDRFVGDGNVDGTGVVTYEGGAETGHMTFGDPGDVIIFRPDGSETATPVIHRAHMWVEADENWVEGADPFLTNGLSCAEVTTCPAQHDGFITHGDANGGYDQLSMEDGARTDVVKPEWVEGKAQYRIPWLGHIRLTVDEVFSGSVGPTERAPSSTTGGINAVLVGTLLGAMAIAHRP